MWKMYQWQFGAVRQVGYIKKLIIKSQNTSIAFYSSDKLNETNGMGSPSENNRFKRVKLSPMSRITEMLSNDHDALSASKKSNDVMNRQSDNADASKENESSTNPINYDSSNPRSVKNLSYIDTKFEKEDMSPALPKRIMRRKPISLSVEDRIQSLKDSEEDK